MGAHSERISGWGRAWGRGWGRPRHELGTMGSSSTGRPVEGDAPVDDHVALGTQDLAITLGRCRDVHNPQRLLLPLGSKDTSMVTAGREGMR